MRFTYDIATIGVRGVRLPLLTDQQSCERLYPFCALSERSYLLVKGPVKKFRQVERKIRLCQLGILRNDRTPGAEKSVE